MQLTDDDSPEPFVNGVGYLYDCFRCSSNEMRSAAENDVIRIVFECNVSLLLAGSHSSEMLFGKVFSVNFDFG